MKINQLNIADYREYRQMYDYTTSNYYDLLIKHDQFIFELKDFKKPVEKSFMSKLFEDWIINPVAFGCFIDNHLVGFIEGGDDDKYQAFRITNVYVDKIHRNQGIGSMMFKHMHEFVKINKNQLHFILETQSCNYPAICFYKKQGYQLIRFNTIDYTNDDIDNKEIRFDLAYNHKGVNNYEKNAI